MKQVILSFVIGALCACSTMSLEDRAAALYGTFVVAEQTGASLIQSNAVSDDIKLRIQAADADAKPVADALLSALVAFRKNRGNPDPLIRAIETSKGIITTLAVETAP